MNKKQLKEYLRARKTFIKNGLKEDDAELFMRKIHRYEKTLHRYAETACERSLTDVEERTQSRFENYVVELLKDHNLKNWKLKFNHDPRGACIMLFLPDKTYNSWDGETYRIHW